MKVVVVLLSVLVCCGSALTPPGTFATPWMDTSLCSPADSLTLCQLKKSQCAPLDQLLTPAGGVVGAVTTCATASGVTLSATFFMGVGTAFMQGKPDALVDQASPDPATATTLRRCVLNTTGLLDPETLTLNRSAVAALVRGALTSPELGETVAAGAMACPEPLDFDVKIYKSCMKAVCMMEAANSPVVSMAQTFLPSLAPTAKTATKKSPITTAKTLHPVPIIFP